MLMLVDANRCATPMFESSIETIEPDQITQYRISCNGSPVSYATVLDLWQSSAPFRRFFTAQLADSTFAGFRWETPAITDATIDRPFEFVLINSPSFCTRPTDAQTYAKTFQ